jgi:hypothetical protein
MHFGENIFFKGNLFLMNFSQKFLFLHIFATSMLSTVFNLDNWIFCAVHRIIADFFYGLVYFRDTGENFRIFPKIFMGLKKLPKLLKQKAFSLVFSTLGSKDIQGSWIISRIVKKVKISAPYHSLAIRSTRWKILFPSQKGLKNCANHPVKCYARVFHLGSNIPIED